MNSIPWAIDPNAAKLFEGSDWVSVYLGPRKRYDEDFVAKQLAFKRFINRTALESMLLAPTEPVGATLVQFWDTTNPPEDVARLIAGNRDFVGARRHVLFDNHSARNFILDVYGSRALDVYDYCHHPAMKSDYFRLCFLFACGGVYVDADVALSVRLPDIDLSRSRIMISALIRKIAPIDGVFQWQTASEFQEIATAQNRAAMDDLILIFANDVIGASVLNDVVGIALIRATLLIEDCKRRQKLAHIHGVTGPGNLTAAVCIHLLESMLSGKHPSDLFVFDRGACVRAGHVSYKHDERYWLLAEEKTSSIIPVL